MARGPVNHASISKLVDQLQQLIKLCLEQHMSPEEVNDTLLKQAKVKPEITKLVWQKA